MKFEVVICVMTVLILSGCGQTGPLYLPKPETPEKAEST
ncbi:MAG: lipoprotein [Gammaproteobacteria bacterium]|jgi:predicted small lipoprotein YifL|nr:lipoprotein [Gammaproteobacteria bacterium]